MSLSHCPSSILLAAGSSQMRRITLCAELTEWPYEWERKKKKPSQAIKSTAPFYHQQLNGSGEQQSIITVLLVLLQACFRHCQKARRQIDLQTNAQILFFKRSLSVFVGAASTMHGSQVWGNDSSRQEEVSLPSPPPPGLSVSFLKDALVLLFLTTKRHPGSPAKEDQYLNYAVVGQHVRVYKIKWALKLISSSPWKSLQVFRNETKMPQRGADLRSGRLVIVFVSPN